MVDESNVNKILERHEIQDEYKWTIEKIYTNDELWEEDFIKVKELSEKFVQFKGKLNSKDVLLDSLNQYEYIIQLTTKIYVYAKMKKDEDNSNSKYQAFTDRGQSLNMQVDSELSFYVPELLQITDEELNIFIQEEPKLKKYHHFLLELIRQRDHVLSIEEENIIAQAGEITQAASNIFTMLNNADIKFPLIKDENGEEVELTKGNYSTFIESKDRRVRKDAFKALFSTYKSLKNTIAATYTANLKQELFYANIKKYPSSLAASLFSSNIPTTVYDNLIDTIHQHLPLMHRYVSLRKKIMALDELHMYDLYTPMVQEVNIKVSYDEAKETLINGLAPLGEEYISILKYGFENRWVDVYENKGKTGGAYSWGTYDSEPFILMNYKDNVNSMFTLAHEMGHSLHSYYSKENQPFIYANYKIFVAEVASTVNEAILMDYMIKKVNNKKEKMYFINQFLEQFRSTVFRQTMFAEFEKITHEKMAKGEALTADDLSKIYYQLNVKYFGEDVIIDEDIAVEWARIPHFYKSFYVYQYATGYSAAIALSKQILKEGQPAVDRYISFLKKGNSDYPINVLKDAGVDMSSGEPIRLALQVFEELLDEMEKMI